MNLEFSFVKDIERNGQLCRLERANVSRSGEFWRAWRSVAADRLRRLIYVTPEDGQWYAYRLRVKNGDGAAYQPFNLTYIVKDTSKLLPYQPRAVAHLVQAIINHGAAADGSDTGLGKTYQALAVCRELSLRPLIVCRKAGMYGWKKASLYMRVAPLAIVNWELLRNARIAVGGERILSRYKRSYRAGYDYRWHVPAGAILIFDEAHMGFNEDSQNYALWTASSGHTSLSLSATFADRPSRCKALFRVLRIMDEQKFDEWLLKKDHFVNQYNVLESLSAVADMKTINRILYPDRGYRVSYDDPDVKSYFPQRVIQTEIVDLGERSTGEQNRMYGELLKKAAVLREMGKQAEFLVADLRYRQHCELLKVPVLVEMVREYRYEGMAVCVFVNFRETLRYLSESLDTKSLIFGGQEQYGLPRENVVSDFQEGKTDLILCMTDAGGQSIDLHDVKGQRRRISLICPTYNPVSLQQVLGRTYRAGSKSVPIMKLVYAAGTVEEKVAETVNSKLDSIAALNNGDLMEPDLFRLSSPSSPPPLQGGEVNEGNENADV